MGFSHVQSLHHFAMQKCLAKRTSQNKYINFSLFAWQKRHAKTKCIYSLQIIRKRGFLPKRINQNTHNPKRQLQRNDSHRHITQNANQPKQRSKIPRHPPHTLQRPNAHLRPSKSLLSLKKNTHKIPHQFHLRLHDPI